MSSCLIMFTNTFPFAQGEYFIENEIKTVAAEFDRVLIFALDCNSGDKITRSIPANVTAFNTARTSKSKLRAVDMLRAGIASLFPSAQYRKETAGMGADFKRRVFWHYFISQAKRKSKEVSGLLRDIDLTEFEDVTLYSYWFFAAAEVAVMQKELLESKNVRVRRVLCRAHGYDIYEYRNKLKFLPRREYLLGKLDAVMPCSHDGVEHLRNQFPAYSDKIIYAPLGTQDRGLTADAAGDEFTLVSCSVLVPVKRVEKIVDALSLYHGERKLRWIHIGGSGAALARLNEYAENKLANVSFELKGQLPNSEVCRFYSENHVSLFINVSESEGVPVSIMEAMSFGMSVIATDVGGTHEIVENGVNGMLIGKDFKDEELAAELEQLASMTDSELELFATNSRKIWEERCNSAVNYPAFTRLLNGKEGWEEKNER